MNNSSKTNVTGSASANQRSNGCKKPFCKVCFDAGKPESMYTNHFVRASPDINAQVICPTLLGLSCRRCGKNGHTVSRCKVTIKQTNNDITVRIAVPKIQKTNTRNLFDALLEDENECIEEKEMPTKRKVSSQPTSVWMDVVKRETMTKALLSSINDPAPKKAVAVINAIVNTDDKMTPIFRYKTGLQGKSWADYESSDDEEEY